jgi:hypothetical protein
MVVHCPHCHKIIHGSLNRHTAKCPRLRLKGFSPKRPSQSLPSPRRSSHKQKVTVSEAETRLLSDTHAASPSAPSLQLHNVGAIKETVTAARLSSHHDSLQHDNDDDDMWSMFDDSSYDHHDSSASSAQAPPPADNVNEDEADAAFMQQFLPFIDPDAANPFDPSRFSEDTMKYVHPKARYTDVLPDHLLAQIDLFRILIRAGCSHSIFDKIINWVQHYSRKSSEDLWLKHQFKSRKKRY